MIRVLKRSQINEKALDNCVEKAHNASITGFSWYLDIACPNWSALVLDDYKAVFPLPIKSKFFIPYLLQPFFIQYFSIYTKYPLNKELYKDFLAHIPRYTPLIDINVQSIPEKLDCSFSIFEKKSQILDLNQPYSSIRGDYSKSLKNNINKASTLLTLTDNVSIDEIVEMYKFEIGDKVNALQLEDYKRLKQLLNKMMQKDCGILKGVKDQKGELIATAFFSLSDKRISFMKSSSTKLGKELNAMSFLLDNIIQVYSDKNIIFDFEGSSIQGVADFNESFGAQNQTYWQLKRNLF